MGLYNTSEDSVGTIIKPGLVMIHALTGSEYVGTRDASVQFVSVVHLCPASRSLTGELYRAHQF